MINIRKSLLKLLLVTLLLSAGTAAFAEPHVFDALYYVVGNVTSNGAVAVGKNVVFYSTNQPYPIVVRASTEASGKYAINIYDNGKISPAGFTTTEAYYVAVEKGADNFGAWPIPFSLDQKGWTQVNLTLEAGAGPVASAEVVDTGWIRNTIISREGENLKLTWGYDPVKGSIAANIYIQTTGTTDSYVANAANYVFSATIPSGTTQAIYNTTAHDGHNYYFRVVPNPLPASTTILSGECNGITVGKTEISLPANKYVFANIAFQSDLVSLKSALAEQLGTAGEFLWWDGQGYHPGTFTPEGWGGDERLLQIGEGFIVRAQTNTKLALTGRFGKLTAPFVRRLNQNTYYLIAYPYPMAQTLEVMGVTHDPLGAEELIKWNVSDQSMTPATYSGGWAGNVDYFEISNPRYYRRPNSVLNWTINFP